MGSLLKMKHYRFLVTHAFPKTRWGDRCVAYLDFLVAHRRRPTKKKTLNDELFRKKNSDGFLSPECTFTTDKDLAKLFIAAVVGDEYNVPTTAVLRNKAEIDRFDFPRNCAVKPTHGTGVCIFVRDENCIDRAMLNSWLHTNWYSILHEANYRYLTPKVIVEPLIFGREDVDDVKFFCVAGSVRMIQVDFERNTRHTRTLLDGSWRELSASLHYPLSDRVKPRPKRLEEMIQVAEKIGGYFDLVRVDMYVDDNSGDFLVGEITHCHGGASERFVPADAEWRIARLLFPTYSV